MTRLGFQTAVQRVSIVEHLVQSAKLLRALGLTITDINQFGASHTPPVQPPDDSDSEDEQDIEETQALPRVEEWRMNLTVLSQYYNVRQIANLCTYN